MLVCPGGPAVKNLPAIQETWVWPLGWEEPLEKEKTTHSSILAWEIPWTEEPGRAQSMGVTESQTQFNNKNNLCPFPSSASTPVLEADGDGCAKPFSHDRLFATLWTVAHQAPLFMGFPSKNTGVGCLALFQGLFLARRSNQGLLCLLHWQVGSLSLAAPGKPGEGGDDVS